MRTIVPTRHSSLSVMLMQFRPKDRFSSSITKTKKFKRMQRILSLVLQNTRNMLIRWHDWRVGVMISSCHRKLHVAFPNWRYSVRGSTASTAVLYILHPELEGVYDSAFAGQVGTSRRKIARIPPNSVVYLIANSCPEYYHIARSLDLSIISHILPLPAILDLSPIMCVTLA